MDGWDIALLVLAAYVAIVVLVRLMIRRRDQLVAEMQVEAEQAQRIKKLAEMQKDAKQPGGRQAA